MAVTDLDDIERWIKFYDFISCDRVRPFVAELRDLRSQLAESQRENDRLREDLKRPRCDHEWHWNVKGVRYGFIDGDRGPGVQEPCNGRSS